MSPREIANPQITGSNQLVTQDSPKQMLHNYLDRYLLTIIAVGGLKHLK